MMQPSRNGMLFVAGCEALVLCAYPDPTWDDPSIGFGHHDKTLKQGDTITIPEAFVKLKDDMSMRAVDLNRWIKVPVTQTQFDALLSAYYEYGMKDRGVLTAIDCINSNQPLAFATTFLGCCKDQSGQVKAGLLGRRVKELLLYFTGNYGSIGTVKLFNGLPAVTKATDYVVQDGDI